MAKNGVTAKPGAMKKSVPYFQQKHIVDVMSNGYSVRAKLLYCRLASFGEEGCWMNNETLMRELGCSESTISRAITNLYKGGELTIVNWNGYGRKIYAKNNPGVRAILNSWFDTIKQKEKDISHEEFKSRNRIRS